MKSFAATCIIFLVMLIAVFNNSRYISRTVDDLTASLEFIDLTNAKESEVRLDGLKRKWEKEKKYIQGSVSHLKIDTVSDLISSLLIYYKHGNAEEYEKTAALLRAALEELRLLEEFSAENIL